MKAKIASLVFLATTISTCQVADASETYIGKTTVGTISNAHSILDSGCDISVSVKNQNFSIRDVTRLSDCTYNGWIYLYKDGDSYKA